MSHIPIIIGRKLMSECLYFLFRDYERLPNKLPTHSFSMERKFMPEILRLIEQHCKVLPYISHNKPDYNHCPAM
jgi:hypothetical protein